MHKTNNETTNNNITAENTNAKSSDGLVSSNTLHQNGLRNEQQNSLLDILMNPDKCQVLNAFSFISNFRKKKNFISNSQKILSKEYCENNS